MRKKRYLVEAAGLVSSRVSLDILVAGEDTAIVSRLFEATLTNENLVSGHVIRIVQ